MSARRNPWVDTEIVDYGDPMDIPDPEIEQPRLLTREEEAREAAQEPPVWKSLGEPAGAVVEKAAVAFGARQKIAPKCDSPIEIFLGVAILCELGHLFEQHQLELRPQLWWGRYRIDFAVLRGAAPVLFIECDGREFHSTPEQLANDRRKDEAAARAGITLLRFSGSEIHRYPDGCVHRVIEHLVRTGAV